MTGKLLLPVILQLLGVVVIIAEFIIPSMGILTITALGLIGYSLYTVFRTVSTMAGFMFVVIDICLIPVLVIVGMKLLAASPITLRSSLDSDDGNRSQPPEWEALIGVAGEAVTDLHPAGTALLNRKRYDVVSQGSFVEKGTAVAVVSVDGNRIVVKKQSTEPVATATEEESSGNG